MSSETPASSSQPTWPALADDHPLSKLRAELAAILSEADYSEVYGLTISVDPTHTFSTNLILQKFLRANANDVEKAKDQLLATLKWRKEFKPLEARKEVHEKKRFDGLGYVIVVEGVPGSTNKKDVITFNVYGSVKSNQDTFGDVDSFLRWRVGLMELGLSKLNLSSATQPIPDYGKGPDPYQGIQIHDYLNVAFLRQDPAVKAASKQAISLFTQYYPETLSRKFFVNVPVIMGWVFKAATLMMSAETLKKFMVLSYGEELVNYLGDGIPKQYGGKGPDLVDAGESLNLTAD